MDLKTLLKESDIVTLHAKVTEETVDLIGKKVASAHIVFTCSFANLHISKEGSKPMSCVLK